MEKKFFMAMLYLYFDKIYNLGFNLTLYGSTEYKWKNELRSKINTWNM
jgi:hypothetical protein